MIIAQLISWMLILPSPETSKEVSSLLQVCQNYVPACLADLRAGCVYLHRVAHGRWQCVIPVALMRVAIKSYGQPSTVFMFIASRCSCCCHSVCVEMLVVIVYTVFHKKLFFA